MDFSFLGVSRRCLIARLGVPAAFIFILRVSFRQNLAPYICNRQATLPKHRPVRGVRRPASRLRLQRLWLEISFFFAHRVARLWLESIQKTFPSWSPPMQEKLRQFLHHDARGLMATCPTEITRLITPGCSATCFRDRANFIRAARMGSLFGTRPTT